MGPLFKNEYATADKGQLNYTGLTEDGENQYKQYLTQVRAARKDPVKRQFEKDHLVWYKNKHGIVMADYESEMVRRANLNPKDGVAQDTNEELEYNDKHLFEDSDGDSASSEEE